MAVGFGQWMRRAHMGMRQANVYHAHKGVCGMGGAADRWSQTRTDKEPVWEGSGEEMQHTAAPHVSATWAQCAGPGGGGWKIHCQHLLENN